MLKLRAVTAIVTNSRTTRFLFGCRFASRCTQCAVEMLIKRYTDRFRILTQFGFQQTRPDSARIRRRARNEVRSVFCGLGLSPGANSGAPNRSQFAQRRSPNSRSSIRKRLMKSR